MPSAPRCAPRMLKIHTNVASSGKAMKCLSLSIQAPGFGKYRSQPGFAESRRYGLPIPAAMAANIPMMTNADWLNAKPKAVPRKGAVQGVASKVAKTP